MATALDGGYALRSAFARAERESEELRRLKDTGKPWPCLDYDPSRLGRDNDTHEGEEHASS